MLKKIIPLVLFVALLSSCVAYKKVPYFIDVPVSGSISEEIKNYSELKIQKDDILAITISSLNDEASAIFNKGNTSSIQNNNANSATNLNGYIVDHKGEIQLPFLGSLKVEGLTTASAREIIQSKLIESDFLKEPVVNLRLANFKISIVGDVGRPGSYPIQSERVTILEALSLAGDLNITGKRDNILLIRESQGQRQQIRLDIQSKELLNSPYYYLQNNDVIYVQPSEAKYASVDTGYRNLSVLFSAISLIVLVITRL